MPRALDGTPLLSADEAADSAGDEAAHVSRHTMLNDGDGAPGDEQCHRDGAVVAAGTSQPASPRLIEAERSLVQHLQADSEPEQPVVGGVPTTRRRCLFALALAVSLNSPIPLAIGLSQLLHATAFEASEASESTTCPFVPINDAAQAEVEKLFALTPSELNSELRCLVGDDGEQCDVTLTKSVALQLVRDANHGLFSETWIASAPITLRNAFLSWLAVKVFFTAADLQDRGLLGVAVAGHGARASVVGGGVASKAGWVAIVGDTSREELSVALRIAGWGVLWGLLGATVGGVIAVFTIGAAGLSGNSTQETLFSTLNTPLVNIITTSITTPMAMLGSLVGIYRQLANPLADRAQQQPTWDEARASLGLTQRQAIGVSVAKLSLWHWTQPMVYLWVFMRYFACSEFMDENQRILGCIVAAREIMYMFSTIIAAIYSPVYLLLDIRTVWEEAETGFDRFYRLFAYLAVPHNFVSLCLANRSAEAAADVLATSTRPSSRRLCELLRARSAAV
eukprot:COSAG06_NODE_4597_length_4113_cov_2.918037_4_plen_510_part_00